MRHPLEIKMPNFS